MKLSFLKSTSFNLPRSSPYIEHPKKKFFFGKAFHSLGISDRRSKWKKV